MTQQVLILRSPTVGNRPLAGTPQGMTYVNFPEGQFGVTTGSGNQDLIGVPMFSASASYVAGNAVNFQGLVYVATGPVAPGAFTLAQWSQVATTGYADGVRYGDNRIINGDMRIDARNNGASGTANNLVYTADRWQYYSNQASKLTWGRNLNAVAGPAGFPYYFGVQSSSAYASVAADAFLWQQPIEADMVSDFAWGTANAQPVILSFWARSSLTGTFGGSVQNYASTRSYPFTFSIPAANTWTKIAITIPGDTGGTWVMSGNAGSINVMFDLGTGATARGPAGAWASVNYFGATGSVSVVATNAATFYVTGVKLEVGSVATPYNRRSLAQSMIDCQRYYEVSSMLQYGIMGSGTDTYRNFTIPFLVTKRVVPTMTYTVTGSVTLGVTPSTNGWYANYNFGNTTTPYLISAWAASAEL